MRASFFLGVLLMIGCSEGSESLDGEGGEGPTAPPTSVGVIELSADPLGVKSPGGKSNLSAYFGGEPELNCELIHEAGSCKTTTCGFFLQPEVTAKDSAGELSVSGVFEATADEYMPGIYLLGRSATLWQPEGEVTVTASGDVVPAFEVSLQTGAMFETPGWQEERSQSFAEDFVASFTPFDGAVRLDFVTSVGGDGPSYFIACDFDGASGELRIPAASFAAIDSPPPLDRGVLWLSSRASTELVAGDYALTVTADTMVASTSLSLSE